MRDDQPITLPLAAPKNYDPSYIDQLCRTLELQFSKLLSAGSIRVSTVNISDLPTSSAGLRVGDLWRDGVAVKVVT